jgi:hypothetical protein
MKILLFIIFANTVFSQEVKYPQIKAWIDADQLNKAESEIYKISTEPSLDPSLSFYLSEILFLKGEREFQRENFKDALEYYQKSSNYWVGNVLLEERIKETKNLIKYGNRYLKKDSIQRENSTTYTGSEPLQVIILDEDTKEKLKNRILKSETKDADSILIPKFYLVYFSCIAFILVITNLIFLYIHYDSKARENRL